MGGEWILAGPLFGFIWITGVWCIVSIWRKGRKERQEFHLWVRRMTRKALL